MIGRWLYKQWYVIRTLFGDIATFDKTPFPRSNAVTGVKGVEHPQTWLYRQFGFWADEPQAVKNWTMVCVGLIFVLALLVNLVITFAHPAALGGSVFIP